MTYKDLLQQLQQLDPARLDDTVTVFDPLKDEMVPVVCTAIIDEDPSGCLVPGQLYQILNA